MFNHRCPWLVTLSLLIMANICFCQAESDAPEDQAKQAPSEKAAIREQWRKEMARVPLPKNGCFNASYPNREWKEVPCGPPSKFPNPPQEGREGNGSGPNLVGAGNGDWSAVSASTISSANGTFRSVNVTGTDTNVFMLQLNTQFFANPPACNGVAGCLGWQQFLYSPTQCGGPCVFMEYWLIGFGATCPAGPWIAQPDLRASARRRSTSGSLSAT